MTILHVQSSVCDRVFVSLGVVSIVPKSEMSPPDSMNTADKALYLAKQQGVIKLVLLRDYPFLTLELRSGRSIV